MMWFTLAIGLVVGFLLSSLLQNNEYINNQWCKFKLKVKPRQYYACYTTNYVENYMIEEYNYLYRVTDVGTNFVRLKLVHNKVQYSTPTDVINVSYDVLNFRYHRYKGLRAKTQMLSDIIKQN